jgi:hypothetical protein
MGSWGHSDLILIDNMLAGVKYSSKKKRELSDVELIE